MQTLRGNSFHDEFSKREKKCFFFPPAKRVANIGECQLE